MSRDDCARLLRDLRRDPALRAEAEALGEDADAVVRWAKARGYLLSQEEAASFFASRGELSDDDLDKVAGGDDAWGGTGTPPPGGGGG